MDWPDLQRLRASGWSLGGHSATHRRLSECVGDELAYEIQEPARALSQKLGAQGIAMAFPFGGRADISDEGRRLVRSHGYIALFNDEFAEAHLPGDPFDIPRIELGGAHETLAWKLRAHGLTLERFRSGMSWRNS
jgi:peptidoglycan/xylan/chitin deacetylase (PgdA/CDA1 family)